MKKAKHTHQLAVCIINISKPTNGDSVIVIDTAGI